MQDKKSVNWLAYCVSWILHLLFLVTTIYIIILCVQKGYTLTTLHTALSTVGCGLLITEATLVVSGEAVLVAKVSRKIRIRIHWVLNVLGLALVAAGLVVIAIQKNQGNRPHFTSDHGRVGLAGTVISLAIGLTGIPTVETRLLPKVVSLLFVKLFHICTGIFSIILLLASQITGIYTGWWRGGELGRELCHAAYVIGAFFLLIKPLYSWGSRIYGISKL